MLERKIEKVWEDNKEIICIVGGACLVIAGSRYLKNMKKLNALNHLIKKKEVMIMREAIKPRFPYNMPITEIKAALDKIEGAKYSDALATFVDGKHTIYIR